MKGIFAIILLAGVVAVFAATPERREEESSRYQYRLCGTRGQKKEFPKEGKVCTCERLILLNRWNCKSVASSTTTTTTTTTEAPTTEELITEPTADTEVPTADTEVPTVETDSPTETVTEVATEEVPVVPVE